MQWLLVIELVVLLVSMAMLQRIRSDEFQTKAVEIVEVRRSYELMCQRGVSV
jgi:hypothetical protein